MWTLLLAPSRHLASLFAIFAPAAPPPTITTSFIIWIYYSKTKPQRYVAAFKLSRLPDSNWGPSLYKRVALPTELRWHIDNVKINYILYLEMGKLWSKARGLN